MNREDILKHLSEPYSLLEEDLKTRAEAMAGGDREIAAALAFSRSLGEVSSKQALGEPPTSDAVFLTQLRQQLDRQSRPVIERSFGGLRVWVSALTACVLLVAGVYLGGVEGGSPYWADGDVYSEFDMIDANIWADTDELDEADADELAAALDVDVYEDFWSETYYSDGPISDDLLELSPEDLEEVLSQFESETFFTTVEPTHEG